MNNREHILREAVGSLYAGQIAAAEQLGKRLLKMDRHDVEAMLLMGMAASKRGDHANAALFYGKCVKCQPNEARYRSRLATAQAAQGRLEQAIRTCEEALSREPNHAPALAGKADALDRLGRVDEAIALLEPCVAAGQEDSNVAYVYANLALRAGRIDDAIAVATRHANEAIPDPVAKRRLLLTLSKAHDRAGHVDDAIAAATAAHEAFFQPFDRVAHQRETREIITAFSAGALQNAPRSNNLSESPVFVVGMPRSGSTLIEQILDAHPRALGAGESHAMPTTVASLMKAIGSHSLGRVDLASLTRPMLDQHAAMYQRAVVPRPGPDIERVVDKMLFNLENLGLIALLLPNARVIFSCRDPLDTCLSCYMQTLSPLGHPYVSSLENLAAMYASQHALMEHWLQALPLPMLRVDYEELVKNQEAQSRRLVEFCGLGWDDACLRFFETGRDARTVSYDQVRQPMYTSAVDRASKYRAHLEPLRAALIDAGVPCREL